MNEKELPSSNAKPKIVLDIYWKEEMGEPMASAIANRTVNICLHENLIIVPDTTEEEIVIKVYVEADGGVTVCYEEQMVSMMCKVIAVTPADLIASSLLGIILGGFGGFGDATHEGEPKTPVS